MKFHVWRTACLMEDEGHDHYRGIVEAADENAALAIACAQWSGKGYFSESNFLAEPVEQLRVNDLIEYRHKPGEYWMVVYASPDKVVVQRTEEITEMSDWRKVDAYKLTGKAEDGRAAD